MLESSCVPVLLMLECELTSPLLMLESSCVPFLLLIELRPLLLCPFYSASPFYAVKMRFYEPYSL